MASWVTIRNRRWNNEYMNSDWQNEGINVKIFTELKMQPIQFLKKLENNSGFRDSTLTSAK